MKQELHLNQSQRLVLTQSLQTRLKCLAMSIPELNSFVEERALINPFLEVETPLTVFQETAVQTPAVSYSVRDLWHSGSRQELSSSDACGHKASAATFSDYLLQQLGEMSLVDSELKPLCVYIVGCLNASGYLDCPIAELAEEMGTTVFNMEQALYVVQSLDPPGVAARSLSECLLLQLAESRDFNERNVRIVCDGLELLARRDYPGLAKLLRCSQEEARQAGELVRNLNPIPSQGFPTGEQTRYIVPEAQIILAGGELSVELNTRQYPKVSLNREYCELIDNPNYKQEQIWLCEQLCQAKELLAVIENRQATIAQLLSMLLKEQRQYFMGNGELLPMTMKDAAVLLNVHTSTVSRTVKDKYIQWQGKVYPLKSFFSIAINSNAGGSISPDTVRRKLKQILASEESPLSDQELCDILRSMGIDISRRTVTKYRCQLGIPPSRDRGG